MTAVSLRQSQERLQTRLALLALFNIHVLCCLHLALDIDALYACVCAASAGQIAPAVVLPSSMFDRRTLVEHHGMQ